MKKMVFWEFYLTARSQRMRANTLQLCTLRAGQKFIVIATGYGRSDNIPQTYVQLVIFARFQRTFPAFVIR